LSVVAFLQVYPSLSFLSKPYFGGSSRPLIWAKFRQLANYWSKKAHRMMRFFVPVYEANGR
jgi:hypothetical protein